jgi:hypothetical protein
MSVSRCEDQSARWLSTGGVRWRYSPVLYRYSIIWNIDAIYESSRIIPSISVRNHHIRQHVPLARYFFGAWNGGTSSTTPQWIIWLFFKIYIFYLCINDVFFGLTTVSTMSFWITSCRRFRIVIFRPSVTLEHIYLFFLWNRYSVCFFTLLTWMHSSLFYT